MNRYTILLGIWAGLIGLVSWRLVDTGEEDQGEGELIAEIVKIDGDSQVLRAGSLDWYNAEESDALFAGDFLQTGENGQIELVFNDERPFTIGENALLKFHMKQNSRKEIRLALLSGKINVKEIAPKAPLLKPTTKRPRPRPRSKPKVSAPLAIRVDTPEEVFVLEPEIKKVEIKRDKKTKKTLVAKQPPKGKLKVLRQGRKIDTARVAKKVFKPKSQTIDLSKPVEVFHDDSPLIKPISILREKPKKLAIVEPKKTIPKEPTPVKKVEKQPLPEKEPQKPLVKKTTPKPTKKEPPKKREPFPFDEIKGGKSIGLSRFIYKNPPKDIPMPTGKGKMKITISLKHESDVKAMKGVLYGAGNFKLDSYKPAPFNGTFIVRNDKIIGHIKGWLSKKNLLRLHNLARADLIFQGRRTDFNGKGTTADLEAAKAGKPLYFTHRGRSIRLSAELLAKDAASIKSFLKKKKSSIFRRPVKILTSSKVAH